MLIFKSNCLKDTRYIASEIFKVISLNVIYGFIGDFGVGKTFFIKCLFDKFIKPLYIHSQSYSIFEKYYFNNYILYHFDFLKIKDFSYLLKLEFNYLLTKNTIMCIEWIDKFYNSFYFFNNLLIIEILNLGKNKRLIKLYSKNSFINNSIKNISGVEQSGSSSGS